MRDLQPRDRLVTMTFTVEELAFIAGAIVSIGDRHGLISRIHEVVVEGDVESAS